MAPKRSITERLTGSIELEDQELIDEIIESEDWLSELSEPCEESIYPNNKINNQECSVLDQAISRPEKEDKTEGLTTEERKHIEQSMQRSEKLMKRLAEM